MIPTVDQVKGNEIFRYQVQFTFRAVNKILIEQSLILI
jgi:hypothetical protein